MVSILKQRRTYVRTIALLLYAWSSIWLMTTSFQWVDAIAQAGVWMTISLVVLTLLAIEYQDVFVHVVLRYVLRWLLVQIFAWSIYSWWVSGIEISDHSFLYKCISLSILHAGIAYVLWMKHHFLRYRAMYGLGLLIRTGVPVYMISLALAVAFGIGASFRPIGIDCSVMSHGVSTFFSNVLPRRQASTANVQPIQQPAQPISTWTDIQQLRWVFTSRVSQYKAMMVDDLVAQKSFLDERVCGAIVEQLRALADLPWVKFSVILLLFLLLWPLLTLYGWFVSGIGVILVYMLMRGWVYKRTDRHVLGRTIK